MFRGVFLDKRSAEHGQKTCFARGPFALQWVYMRGQRSDSLALPGNWCLHWRAYGLVLYGGPGFGDM